MSQSDGKNVKQNKYKLEMAIKMLYVNYVKLGQLSRPLKINNP
jgi:hypothetical protein